MSTPPLAQIAFSVLDLRRTEAWFHEGLGFLPAGGNRWLMRAFVAGKVQGLPGAASTCWWLVGRNPWFQIELFQFDRPKAALMPPDARACDIGYRRIGVAVADFDATLDRLAHLGSEPMSPPLGARGARRACVRSPDGVFVEIMEDDPLRGQVAGERDCAAAMRSITLSVPDLDATLRYLQAGFGLSTCAQALHGPQHEALWGLAGARTRSALLRAGDVLIEVVQYLDPPGAPRRPGYRISDQGILNMAFGARNRADHERIAGRAIAAGGRPNWRTLQTPGAGVVYVNDPQDFSIEVLWMKPGLNDRLWGFEPLPRTRRPDADTQRIEQSIRLDASPERVWAVVSDHERMAQWSGFPQVRLTRDGSGERNGHGAQRWMKGPLGTVTEQVTDWQPLRGYRYRVLNGAPFDAHQGELRLRPDGDGTELTWTIRFRPKLPLTGALLRRVLDAKLGQALRERLKPIVESQRSA